MEATTYQEVQGLSRMTVGELRDKYIEVFGEETRSYHREFLRKRIAWRIQAQAEGDLSERARRRAEELANDADLRTRAPRDPVSSGSAEVKARTATGRISPSCDPRLPLQVPLRHRPGSHREQVEWVPLLRYLRWSGQRREPQTREEERMSRNNNRGRGEARESASRTNGTIRCAIYTRKSTDEGLEQEFNSLDMTSLIAGALQRHQLVFPIEDLEIEDQFTTHTYTLHDGRIVYSKGNDHIIDAVRCAMLAREQSVLNQVGEETVFLVPLTTEPVFI